MILEAAQTVNLPVILLALLMVSTSPGPATLAIAGTSMASGRRSGLALASGITAGSLTWSVSAALGMGAMMMTHAWMLEVVRYIGAAYLLWLAFRSARSALSPRELAPSALTGTRRQLFAKGLALHLTNPKAILFFGSLYAIAIPPETPPLALAVVIGAMGVQTLLVFHGIALLFSSRAMTALYLRLRRWFEGAFAVCFGLAGLKVLTARF